MVTRVAFQSATRVAAVQLLTDYAASAGVKLQVYRARPQSVVPPTAFVDSIAETLTDYTITTRQRSVRASVVVLHGLFDSGEAVDQRDKFVDGFLDYVVSRYHQAGPNTLIAGVAVSDDPTYVADWIKPPNIFFATVITLEGYAST